MIQTYTVGNSTTDQIKVSVIISSYGMVQTVATLLLQNHNLAEPDPVATSTNHSGSILQQTIGVASNCVGKILDITSIVALTGADLDTRKLQASKVSVIYLLEGGPNGTEKYEAYDVIVPMSPDYTLLYISKDINLIQGA